MVLQQFVDASVAHLFSKLLTSDIETTSNKTTPGPKVVPQRMVEDPQRGRCPQDHWVIPTGARHSWRPVAWRAREITPTTGPVSSTMLRCYMWDCRGIIFRMVSVGAKKEISGPAVPACIMVLPDYVVWCAHTFFHYMITICLSLYLSIYRDTDGACFHVEKGR